MTRPVGDMSRRRFVQEVAKLRRRAQLKSECHTQWEEIVLPSVTRGAFNAERCEVCGTTNDLQPFVVLLGRVHLGTTCRVCAACEEGSALRRYRIRVLGRGASLSRDAVDQGHGGDGDSLELDLEDWP